MDTRKHPVQGTHSVRSVLPIKRSLVDAVLGPPQPLKRKGDAPPQAGASAKKNGQVSKHPDNVVLEIRRLYEQAGLSRVMILELLYSKGIEVAREDIVRYTSYQTRGSLVPSADAAPYI